MNATETDGGKPPKDHHPEQTEWLIPGVIPETGLILVHGYGAEGVARNIRVALARSGHQSAINAPYAPDRDTMAVALEVAAVMPAILIASRWWSAAEIAEVAKVAAVTIECSGDYFAVGGKGYHTVPDARK